MAKIRKPQVMLSSTANKYTENNERIIEFFFPDAQVGGLISFWTNGEQAEVNVYRYDKGINVIVGKPMGGPGGPSDGTQG